ncbi:MAG TPA: glycerophosphodiester phosphodiesterase family protein [Pyrinomonadaceae bacterium]|jgi:glycerophosphoryl diester phosphodiesterase
MNAPLTPPLIIGHRGAAAVAPENTLVSFARAFADGADGIEFDVRLARDQVPVVIHDATLRRTAARPGFVAAHTAAELAAIDVGSWFNRRFRACARADYTQARIPTLAQVLALAQTHAGVFYVELKCERGGGDARRLAARVVETVHEHGAQARVVIESFNLTAVAEVRRLAPHLPTAALFERRLARPFPTTRALLARARACGAHELALHHTLVNARTAAAARHAGFAIVVWTVDNPARLGRLISLGVRAVITNDPARMMAQLAALRHT